MQQGIASVARRRPGDAISAFDAACRLEPSRIEGWINLGVCLNAVGQPAQALRAFDAACSLESGSVQAQLNRGRTLAALGRNKAALTVFETAVTLERSALTLNDLASALRAEGRSGDALALYLEACGMDPDFSLPQVNYAICLLELDRLGEARLHLEKLSGQTLPDQEDREVRASLASLAEWQRLETALAQDIAEGRASRIQTLLDASPAAVLNVDQHMMVGIARYVASACALGAAAGAVSTPQLPSDWSRIEGLFMVPVIESVAQYCGAEPPRVDEHQDAAAWQESEDMARAVEASRSVGGLRGEPARDEAQLRLWHGIACQSQPGHRPGQFKLVRNLGGDRQMVRAQPNCVAGTLRELFGSAYHDSPPGVPRALVLLMAINDIHPFANGNGRVSVTAMNRELEKCGLAPALFDRSTGYRGELSVAMAKVRRDEGNLRHLLPVLRDAQERAVRFCGELSASAADGPATE